jgi:hypothetical protein
MTKQLVTLSLSLKKTSLEDNGFKTIVKIYYAQQLGTHIQVKISMKYCEAQPRHS